MSAIHIGEVVLASLWIGGAITLVAALVLLVLATPQVRYRVAAAALVTLAAAIAGFAVWGESAPAPWMAWLAPVWLGGAGAALIRLGNSVRSVARLRQRARPASLDWQRRLDQAAARLGLTRPVSLLLSECREVPCTIGVRSPAIIFPAALLPRLTASQWEALVLHELVHVRRRDYLWHVLQSLIAAVFFYHPAVRWLTDVIAREREACCDVEAASACGPLAVADSLAAAERHRLPGGTGGLNAPPQGLRSRVETLLDEARGSISPSDVARSLTTTTLAGAVGVLVSWPVGTVALPAPSLPLMAATALGLAIGLRHAFEPDHLMAVATLVAGERGVPGALRLGASWGIGHTLALFAVGSLMIAARLAMPDEIAAVFELAVAVMIFFMGVRAIVTAWRLTRDGDVTVHAHGDRHHAHAMAGAHVHIGGLALATRPLMVGLVHGLAGSGALTALAMASLPSWPEQLAFMLLFGLGSTAGMAAVAGLAGWPLARLVRTPAALSGLSAATGLAAICFSVAWGAPLLLAPFGR